jgi:putative pyruvate formate lyase activating enzyme
MSENYTPNYKKLTTKEFEEKIEKLNKIASKCTLCPRKCQVNRLKGEKGYCGAPGDIVVSSYFAHFGEEVFISGTNGSGTIFFSFCNLKCVFCQNYDISFKKGDYNTITPYQLSKYMIYLEKLGCHNINLVTPTHFIFRILQSIKIASENGLSIPIVYNCGGYESVDVIKILDGVIDIYMPDIKFFFPETSQRYANAPDYFDNIKDVIKTMYQQVGNLKIIDGVAKRGLLIRHLIMPEHLDDTEKILKFISEEISKDVYINLMDQYHPAGQSYRFPEISRTITNKEFERGIKIAKVYGLHNIIY